MHQIATTSVGSAVAATQRVRECKAQLFRTLQRRHRDAWRTYWTAFQQYLVAKLSIHQFQSTAERLLSEENIWLHNAFVITLLQDCSDPGDFYDTDENNSSDSSTGGSESSAGDRGVSEVKIESSKSCSFETPDAESAALLIGLGRSTSH